MGVYHYDTIRQKKGNIKKDSIFLSSIKMYVFSYPLKKGIQKDTEKSIFNHITEKKDSFFSHINIFCITLLKIRILD